MNIIIPMAGMGKRMRPHTLTTPKPLIPIAGKPMVQRIVEDIVATSNEKVDEIAFIINPSFGKEVEQHLTEVAEALGAKVYSHAVKEIGWFPVEKVFNHPLTDFLPPTFTTFHWHGDTFNLPNGAIQLFKTKACDQQGFVYNHVATLQFHMEVREDLLQEMAAHE